MKKYIRSILLGAGLVAMLFPVYYILCIIYADLATQPQQDFQERFLSFFPPSLQDSFNLTLIAIACCVFAVICSLLVLPTQKNKLQDIAVGLLFAAMLQLCWFIFILM